MSKLKRVVDESTGEILDPRTNPEYYTLDAIRHAEVWTPENIRSEYTRLRKIAEQRLRVIGADEIGAQSYTYHRNKGRFKPVSQLTAGQTKIMLSEVARMISAKTGTLSGIKRQRLKAIKTLQQHGYDFINEHNYWEFGEFMREWKASQYRGYGSLVAVDFWEAASAIYQDVTGEDFERATMTSSKKNLIATEFHNWRMDRKAFSDEGKKQNRDKVSSKELMEDWKQYLE